MTTQKQQKRYNHLTNQQTVAQKTQHTRFSVTLICVIFHVMVKLCSLQVRLDSSARF